MGVIIGGFLGIVLLIAMASSFLVRYTWWCRFHWMINGPLVVVIVACVVAGVHFDGTDKLKGLLMYVYAFVASILLYASLRPIFRFKGKFEDEEVDEATLKSMSGGFQPSPYPKQQPETDGDRSDFAAHQRAFAWRFEGDRRWFMGSRLGIAMAADHGSLVVTNLDYIHRRTPRIFSNLGLFRRSGEIPLDAIQSVEFIQVLKHAPSSGGHQFLIHVADGYYRLREDDFCRFDAIRDKLSFLPDESAQRGKRALAVQDLFVCILVFLLIAGVWWFATNLD